MSSRSVSIGTKGARPGAAAVASFIFARARNALSRPPSSQLCAPCRVGATIQKRSTPKVKSASALPSGLNLNASAESRTGRDVPCSARIAGQPREWSHSSGCSGQITAAAATAPSWSRCVHTIDWLGVRHCTLATRTLAVAGAIAPSLPLSLLLLLLLPPPGSAPRSNARRTSTVVENGQVSSRERRSLTGSRRTWPGATSKGAARLHGSDSTSRPWAVTLRNQPLAPELRTGSAT